MCLKVNRYLFSFVFLLLMLQSCAVFAMEDYDMEATCSTGMTWWVPGEGVTYEVSDDEIAEIVCNADGAYQLKLKRPGDVYVTAWIPDYDMETVYLLHVTGQPVDETAVDRATFAQEVLDIVNRERAKLGRAPLRLADDLLDSAAVRAEEISRYFSHTRPDGRPFHTVLNKSANCSYGENIAAGTASPEAVMEQWMNSPGHRANILKADYRELGVGYFYLPGSEYEHYWVQLFRRRS